MFVSVLVVVVVVVVAHRVVEIQMRLVENWMLRWKKSIMAIMYNSYP